MSLPRRALVTGATGYLGFHLVRRLVHDGWRVHALVRRTSKTDELERLGEVVHVHRVDGLQLAATQLMDIVAESAPDVLFHVAAIASTAHQHMVVAPMIEANITFPTLLVDTAVACGVRSVVNTGTYSTHFENRDYDPASLYAATKKAFEDLLVYYSEAASVSAVTLELFDVYGPRDPRPKFMNLLRDATAGCAPLDLSPGQQKIDLIYVDDVVAAFVAAARRLQDGEVAGVEKYAIGTGTARTLREVVDIYSRVTGREIAVRWGARPYRKREIMEPWNRGKRLPGWVPEIGLEEGIRRIEAAERTST